LLQYIFSYHILTVVNSAFDRAPMTNNKISICYFVTNNLQNKLVPL